MSFPGFPIRVAGDSVFLIGARLQEHGLCRNGGILENPEIIIT